MPNGIGGGSGTGVGTPGGNGNTGEVAFFELLVPLLDPETGITLRNDAIVSNDFDEVLKVS